MINAIALLLETSSSVRFQMMPLKNNDNNESEYRIVISPVIEDEKLSPSNAVTNTAKTVAQCKASLVTPFTITGTCAELEVQIPQALAQISTARVETKNNLDVLLASLSTSAKAKAVAKKATTATKPTTKVTATKTPVKKVVTVDKKVVVVEEKVEPIAQVAMF